jgi:hypothetical protein
MATSRWPNEVSIVLTRGCRTLLTDCEQESGGNVLVYREAIEMLQRPTPDAPDASMDSGRLYEGNFDEWLSKTYPHLGLTAEVSRHLVNLVLRPQSEANQYQTSSILATHSILSMVWRDFLRRQKLPAGHCRTVLDLLRQLNKGCATFRFFDLPLELREMIYGILLESSDCYDEQQGIQGTLPSKPNRVIPISNVRLSLRSPTRSGSPHLLHVSRQVRSEAGKLYFGSKQFEIYINPDHSICAQTEVQMWLKTIVGDFAAHLRDVSVHLIHDARRYNRHYTTIHAQFGQSHGLQITVSTQSCNYALDVHRRGIPRHFFDLPAYVADLEEKRIARNQRGEIIAEFFEDWDTLRTARAGPHEKLELLPGTSDYVWRECEPDDPDGRLCEVLW